MANSPLSIIKSYLVSLGFQVDKSSYDSATHAIDSVSKGLSSFAGDTVKQFGLATVAVTSFVATSVAGIAKFVSGLGNAQIQYEMLAHQMWTTQQNAEAFSTTLKAMGRSLNDLYLSPTLMQQFMSLNKQAFEMMPPAEYQQQMQFIQNISFQFTRMKLEGTYALQWIGYYFIKYMSGPINNIYQTLSHVNDIIIKTMPYWTKVVAEVMSWFAQFGITTVQAIKDIARIFNDIGQSIPNNIKLIGLAILGLAAIASTGPIGWITSAIIALGLAVNDFYTYIHGGQSEFGQFWQKLIDIYNILKDSGAIDAFKNGFKIAFKDISSFINDAIKGIENFYQTLDKNGTAANFKKTLQNEFEIIHTLTKDAADWFKSMYDAINKSGVLKDLSKDTAGLVNAISNVTQAITGLINSILGLKGTQSVIKAVGDWFTSYILHTLQGIDLLIKSLTSELNAMADLFTGKWGDAWKNFKGIFTNLMPSNQSYIYPNSSSNNTNNSSNVKVSVNQNIYGSSDPTATGNAATNNLTTIMRNTKGVIV